MNFKDPFRIELDVRLYHIVVSQVSFDGMIYLFRKVRDTFYREEQNCIQLLIEHFH